ncbi:unnamed protein product [Rangifer tarandus platyrhynchus]|uniref:Uncharacterized protein n=2 Tax=Rangifer tarandus platyrhynchus TaxID=3082113 RepID=A0ABN8YT94_RANTA|nr:unnamed protein product [Rangifer tarandus platyrhynchus]
MPPNRLILCRPFLPSVFPSIRVFSKELALCVRWPEYWNFSFSISHSNEYSAKSPRILDCVLQFLFVFYGTLFEVSFLNILLFNFTVQSLLQHHSPKASIQCSVFL